MMRFTALWSNDDSLNRWALAEARAALRWDVTGEAGLGLGWVQDGRSLLRRHPGGAGEPMELVGQLSEVRSRTVLGCVDSGATMQSVAELAPFRFRGWLYAVEPSAPLGDEVKAAIAQGLPDFLRRNIDGTSDGEALFHHLLAELYRRDVFNMAHVEGRVVADALATSLEGIARMAPAAVERLQCVAMAERLMVGASCGGPMAIRQWRGIEEPAPPPLFAGHRPRAITFGHYKATLILSGAQPAGESWAQLEPDHLFWIGRDGAVEQRER